MDDKIDEWKALKEYEERKFKTKWEQLTDKEKLSINECYHDGNNIPTIDENDLKVFFELEPEDFRFTKEKQ